MRRFFSLAVLLVSISGGPLFAQTPSQNDDNITAIGQAGKKEQAPKKFSFELSSGSFKFPGLLFEMDGSLVTHPDNLSGYITSLSVNYHFGKSGWSLGPEFSRISASGSGEWARSDTQSRLDTEGVAGRTTGELNIRAYEFAVVAKKEFFTGAIRPYVKFGGGVAVLKADFLGQFNGHETQSGFDFPISEPAEDRSRRLIPVFVFEPGISFEKEHATFSVGPYWNTGWGMRATFRLMF